MLVVFLAFVGYGQVNTLPSKRHKKILGKLELGCLVGNFLGERNGV